MKKILIANRGEIALRVIRAARDLGIKTVVAYSQADKDSLPVLMADEKICIGEARVKESYLNIPNIIAAAEVAEADAIHPGYGFLSENPKFSEICAATGIKFIGPSKDIIEKMGDKATARSTMQNAGVPIVPGTGIIESEAEALSAAESIGFPVLIKATAGGGGRGMRICTSSKEFVFNFNAARAEAEQSFGNGSVYIEKYISSPKHIEVQVMGDAHGNAFHFFERDCSIQRRHQKLIEEAPGFILPPATREAITEAAVRATKEVGYIGAGTLEFLYDQEEDKFYFIEMNTRIQVEHPITEMITGIDLVQQQILAAMGEKLALSQSDIHMHGHAIECRINAENAMLDFRPSIGTIEKFIVPGGFGVRVDTYLYEGYSLSPFYDSLLAKLIVWGQTREEAISRMAGALSEFQIEGVNTTIPFHLNIMKHTAFLEGKYTTRMLDNL